MFIQIHPCLRELQARASQKRALSRPRSRAHNHPTTTKTTIWKHTRILRQSMTRTRVTTCYSRKPRHARSRRKTLTVEMSSSRAAEASLGDNHPTVCLRKALKHLPLHRNQQQKALAQARYNHSSFLVQRHSETGHTYRQTSSITLTITSTTSQTTTTAWLMMETTFLVPFSQASLSPVNLYFTRS